LEKEGETIARTYEEHRYDLVSTRYIESEGRIERVGEDEK